MAADRTSAGLALIELIRANDLIGLEQMLATGAAPAQVNQADPRGLTPLLWAIRQGSQAMVERLLAAGADPNLGPRPNAGPLPYCISLREHQIARLLMQAGGLDLPRQGYLAATEAVLGGDIEGLQCLVANGLDLHQAVPAHVGQPLHSDQATALLFIATNYALHRPELFRCLLEQGARPEAATADGRTPVSLVCQKRNAYPASLATLLAAGAPPEQPDQAGYAPLHYAAANNHLACVELLIDYGASASRLAGDGTSPLLWAAASHRPEVHAALLARQARQAAPGAEKSPRPLSPAWHWIPGEACWGGLALTPGDGAWNEEVWAHNGDQVMAGLEAQLGSARGRTPPRLVVRLVEGRSGRCEPQPWLVPGQTGTLSKGQTLAMSYFALSFPNGIPRAMPAQLIHRFVLSRAEDQGRAGELQGRQQRVEIVRIVGFEEGRVEDLEAVEVRFDGGQWQLFGCG